MTYLDPGPIEAHPYFGNIFIPSVEKDLMRCRACGNTYPLSMIEQACTPKDKEKRKGRAVIPRTGAVGECPFCHSEKVGRI